MPNSRQPFWKLIVLSTLFVSALGAAYVGFQSAGGSHPNDSALRGKNGKHSGVKRATGDLHAPNGDGTIDEDKDDSLEPDSETELYKRLKKFFSEKDESALQGLKPIGISQIEGEGGKGLNRQVKANGKWYPVFDLGKVGGSFDDAAANPGMVDLTRVPLSITSANPPRGKVNQPYSFRFEAIGGLPPYHWSMQPTEGTAGFSLDQASGLLSGVSNTPVTATLNIFVADSSNGHASTSFSLVIAPETPLAITTTMLPVATVGEPYHAVLTAEGGVTPYEWTISTSNGTWMCDAMTGEITGNPTQAEETSLTVTLTDNQRTTVQKILSLNASNGIDIVTETQLPPAAPNNRYTQSFEASGGSAPYTWKIVDGSLPDGWTFSAEGLLTGVASTQEALYDFTVEVTDNDGQTFRKSMHLAVIEALVAIPSRERAGLAWQPESLSRSVGAALQGISIQRNGPNGKVEVYRGLNSTNMVDRNLTTGASYEYTLTAHTVDGRAVPFGATRIKILPMSLQRGVQGTRGDPFVDRVRAFKPLSVSAYGTAGLPFNVTGPPDGRSTYNPASAQTEVVSLNAKLGGGLGGTITLEFTDNIVELGDGLDFTIFENVFFDQGRPQKRFMEPAVVEVALFDGQWYRFPINVNPPVNGEPVLTNPSYYAQGFAGVNGTTGDKVDDPNRSGGDSFDANALGIPNLTWIRFIRIQSTGHKALRDLNGTLVYHTDLLGALSGVGSSGFDLDAVCAVNY
ncbi:MAG: S-layer domain protein [Verrucomicrobiaceae bacterium]|nr:S-layer domain protein [Verrucomicrobiaceae bacterium]